MTLHLGDFRETLAGESWDLLSMDGPYGPRTHAGHDGASQSDKAERRTLSYYAWSGIHIFDAMLFLLPRTRGWACCMCSHDQIPFYEDAMERANRYVFAPIPIILRYKVRRCGDGPGSSAVFMVVSRPRSKAFIAKRWGSLPGHYIREKGDEDSPCIGGKPLGVLRRIIADYSKPGDVVCDPTAGGGTTLIAALMEGRQAIGSEVDEDTWKMAAERLRVAMEDRA